MFDFKNKIAVVTGGARGIGKCIRQEFEKAGATVLVIDLLPNDYFVGDLTDKSTLEAFAEKVIGEYGRVDFLINNAAPRMCGIESASYEDFENALRVGVTAPFYLTKLFAPYFKEGASVVNTFKQFIDGITDTKTSMWIMLSGNIINIIFNYILIFGKGGFPELGLLGAGIATLLSRMAMLAFAMIIFFRSSRYRTYMQGFFAGSITLAEQKHLNSIGMPVALQMGMETASFSLVAIMVGWLGTKALAAHQIMCTVGQLGFMIYYGMAAAVAVKTSNYNGAGDIPNIRRSANAGFRIIAVMAIIASFTMLLLRNRIGDLFTNDKEVALLVSQLIIPFVLYQFGDGLQCSFSNALRGIADVKPVMRYAFISYFVISLPIGYLFAFTFNMGLTGIWLSFPFGLTTAGVLFYLRFMKKTRIINN